MASSQSTEQINAKSTDEIDGIGVPNGGHKRKSNNLFVRAVLYHYGGTGYKRTDEQIAREEWLIPYLNIIRYNRWFALPAAVIIQFCSGSLYAWSVFNKPIDNLIYGDPLANMAAITFYIAVGCFGSSAALMGPWLERNGPKRACLLGTSIFFFGNLLTALALHLQYIWLVYIGYGIFCGFGLGLCYISPVSCLQKWFPDRRGLAAGFAVCGFGAGSIAIAKVQIPLINSVGLPLTFVVLGSAFFILMAISGLILRTPPPNFTVHGISEDQTKVGVQELRASNNQNDESIVMGEKNGQKVIQVEAPEKKWTLIESLMSGNYRLMYLMFLSNAIFGLVVISRLSNMITDIFLKTPEEASTIVSINGGFNLVGRLVFSILSDYIGRKNCFILMLTLQLVIVASFSIITLTQTYWAFLMTMWVLTSCYGAGFGVIPGFLSDTYGSSNIGALHGIILTAWSIAGVGGGLIFTAIYHFVNEKHGAEKPSYPYNVNSYWILAIILIGYFAIMFVGPTKLDTRFNDRIKRFVRGKIFRRSVNIVE